MRHFMKAYILQVVLIFISFKKLFPGNINGIAGYITDQYPEWFQPHESFGEYLYDIEMGKQVFPEAKSKLDGSRAEEDRHFPVSLFIVYDEYLGIDEFFKPADEFLPVNVKQAVIIREMPGKHGMQHLIGKFELIAIINQGAFDMGFILDHFVVPRQLISGVGEGMPGRSR